MLSEEAKKFIAEAAELIKVGAVKPLWYWSYGKFNRRAHIIDPKTRMSLCKKIESMTDAQFIQAVEHEENPFNVYGCEACKKVAGLGLTTLEKIQTYGPVVCLPVRTRGWETHWLHPNFYIPAPQFQHMIRLDWKGLLHLHNGREFFSVFVVQDKIGESWIGEWPPTPESVLVEYTGKHLETREKMKLAEIGQKVIPFGWYCKGKSKVLAGKTATVTGYNEESRDGTYYALKWDDPTIPSFYDCCQADAFKAAKS